MNRLIIIIIAVLLTQFIYGQETCGNSKNIFVVTETMPVPSPELTDIEKLINGKYNITICDLEEGDKFLVQFKINCKGEDFDYQAMKFNKEPLNCDIAEFLQKTITWTIAKQRNKAVDFSGTLVFKVSNSRFILLSESVNKMSK